MMHCNECAREIAEDVGFITLSRNGSTYHFCDWDCLQMFVDSTATRSHSPALTGSGH